MPKIHSTRSRRTAAPKPSQSRKAEPTSDAPPRAEWREEHAATQARWAASLNLKKLSERDLAFLAVCQKIHSRWTGCGAPFEEFFVDLVHRVGDGRWPTPDDVVRELGSFRENFEDMRRDAAAFLEAYPEAGHAS